MEWCACQTPFLAEELPTSPSRPDEYHPAPAYHHHTPRCRILQGYSQAYPELLLPARISRCLPGNEVYTWWRLARVIIPQSDAQSCPAFKYMFVQTTDNGVYYDRHDAGFGDVTERMVLVTPRSAGRSIQVVTGRQSHAVADVCKERVSGVRFYTTVNPLTAGYFLGRRLQFAIWTRRRRQ